MACCLNKTRLSVFHHCLWFRLMKLSQWAKSPYLLTLSINVHPGIMLKISGNTREITIIYIFRLNCSQLVHFSLTAVDELGLKLCFQFLNLRLREEFISSYSCRRYFWIHFHKSCCVVLDGDNRLRIYSLFSKGLQGLYFGSSWVCLSKTGIP